MCFCFLEWNRQQPGQRLMLELEHGIKQEAVQSPKALIYNTECHQDWRRNVVWPEESHKTDQLITTKSTSPMDDSIASADHYGCDKKGCSIFRSRPGGYH